MPYGTANQTSYVINLGEDEVRLKLEKLSTEHYRSFHDILLRTNHGTTQIDHVIISTYGIFVIETKNYNGWIIGTDHEDEWIKYRDGEEHTFHNPIKQNYAHVKALEEKLGQPNSRFVDIVVFAGEATIDVDTTGRVIPVGALLDTIKSYQQVLLSQAEMESLCKKLERNNIRDDVSRQQHIRQVNAKASVNRDRRAQGRCPRCGGTIVHRQRKYGAFVGCHRYPQCNYIEE